MEQLWNAKGTISLADLGNDYYLARFTNEEDYDRALLGGLWLIANHYLTVQQWRPNFDPDQETIKKVVVWIWIRIPHLPIEYYDKALLRRIGNRLGKTMKVDVATEKASRAKYARLTVKVDLTKPLIAKFRMRRRIWRLEYEGIHLICFRCGKYGHKEEDFPRTRENDAANVEDQEDTGVQSVTSMTRLEVTEQFGPWMLV